MRRFSECYINGQAIQQVSMPNKLHGLNLKKKKKKGDSKWKMLRPAFPGQRSNIRKRSLGLEMSQEVRAFRHDRDP
jgi:hypothetical protein